MKRMQRIPRDCWPSTAGYTFVPVEVWKGMGYLVQLFDEGSGVLRMTVNSVERSGDRWVDGLTWDVLQDLKRQVGRGDCYAVEVYPRDRDIVNVANMRHLWIMPEPLPFGWTRDPDDLDAAIGPAGDVPAE